MISLICRLLIIAAMFTSLFLCLGGISYPSTGQPESTIVDLPCKPAFAPEDLGWETKKVGDDDEIMHLYGGMDHYFGVVIWNEHNNSWMAVRFVPPDGMRFVGSSSSLELAKTHLETMYRSVYSQEVMRRRAMGCKDEL